MTNEERIAQVQNQCRVVAHLARVLADVHDTYANFLHPDLTDLIGKRSAELMEELGEIINGMDAVSEADEWTDPIYRVAQQLYPTA